MAAAETGKERKRVLRAEMRQRRAEVAPVEAAAAGMRAAALLDGLLDRLALSPSSIAAVFAALAGEIDTTPIEATLRVRGFRIAWPRVDGDHLTLHLVERSQLAPAGRFAIAEPPPSAPRVRPAELGLVIVPGLAFDAAGRRLGHGRGYYDRLLECAPGAVRVAPCLPEQLVSTLPHEAHDQPVDFLLLCGHNPHILPTEARGPLVRSKENL